MQGFRQRPVQKQAQKPLQRQRLRAPVPPNALRGLEGLRVADEILRSYKSSGLLIGGLAKEIWRTTKDASDLEERLNRHKDVDVLILSPHCRHHPKQWEGGIDWWVSHRDDFQERPTNGSSIGILWMALDRYQNISGGLSICSREDLRASIEAERKVFPDMIIEGCRMKKRWHDLPTGYPIPHLFPLPSQLRIEMADERHPVANYCSK